VTIAARDACEDISLLEGSPHGEWNTKRCGELGGDQRDRLAFRSSDVANDGSTLPDHRQRRESAEAAATLVIVRDRRPIVRHARPWIRVEDADEAISMREWQRPQKDPIDHSEDRQVGPECEGECCAGGQGEGWRLSEAPRGVPNIATELVE